MVHFFILLPLLVILGGILVQLSRRHPENISIRYARNFLLIWSVCTLAIGAAETFFQTSYAKSMALAIAVPFLYVASAYLVKLPFALYQKSGWGVNLLIVLIIGLGVLFGLTTLVNAQQLIPALGPLQGLFRLLVKHQTALRIWSTLAIFVPVGIFFLLEMRKSREWHTSIRLFLIGIGLVVAGVSEYFHIQAKHAAGADFYTVLGFFLITAGFLYASRREAPALAASLR